MKRLFIIALAVVSLGGCAIIHKPTQKDTGIANAKAWQVHQNKVAALTGWALQGRVASGKLLGWTGNLNWRQTGAHFNVRLAGPLGAGGMVASGTLDRVHVRTADRNVVTDHPDALVARQLGFAFPLEALRYWGRGVPAPGTYKAINVDAKGRLRALTQNGWRIGYRDYVTTDLGLMLPKRIVLDNDKNRMRLVVDRWFDLKTADGSG